MQLKKRKTKQMLHNRLLISLVHLVLKVLILLLLLLKSMGINSILEHIESGKRSYYNTVYYYIFAPRNLAFNVTIKPPIQTTPKTTTIVDAKLEAVLIETRLMLIIRYMLSKIVKNKGPHKSPNFI